jgi:hypothetical protein
MSDFITINNTDPVLYELARRLRAREDSVQTHVDELSKGIDNAIEQAIEIAIYLIKIKQNEGEY